MARYDYLSNPMVLQYIDTLKVKVLYARVIILDMQDRPIRAIEGQTTGGSINLNGSSAVRRTGSLSLVTKVNEDLKASPLDILNQVTNVETLISMNKRVSIEIGIDNNGFQYKSYDRFWFPMGTFVIKNATVTHNNQGISISLTLSDKMSLLNGDCGGKLSAAIDHNPIEVIAEDGSISKDYVLFKTLIYELLTEAAELPENQIIIEDVPLTIKNTVRWAGTEKLYMKLKDNGLEYILTTTQSEGAIEYEPRDSIGYMTTEFTYPDTLSSNFGETIVSVMDKIKNKLGNYEYFFDVDGIFHFQAIKNYLNEGSSIDNLSEAINDKYFLNLSGGKSIYRFTDANLISAYSNNPQYELIKNDITAWGKKSDSKNALRYHIVIDTPPKAGNWYKVESYTDKNGILRASRVEKAKEGDNGALQTDDWRQELYLSYICEGVKTFLAKEIIEEIPKIYDITFNRATKLYNQSGFYHNDDPNAVDYYFDMIDPAVIVGDSLTQPMKQFGVKTIGRRIDTLNDDDVNCVFLPKVPNILFIREDDPNRYTLEQQCIWNKQKYAIVNSTIAEYIGIGSFYNSAYDLLRTALHQYTSYNNNINLTTMPIYYLEPNMRITVDDNASDIHGDYVINTISIPLTLNGTTTINAKRAIERI